MSLTAFQPDGIVLLLHREAGNTLDTYGSSAGTAKSPTPPGCSSRSDFPHAALQERAVGSLGLYTCAVIVDFYQLHSILL